MTEHNDVTSDVVDAIIAITVIAERLKVCFKRYEPLVERSHNPIILKLFLTNKVIALNLNDKPSAIQV